MADCVDAAGAVAFAARFGQPNIMTFANGRVLRPEVPTSPAAEAWLKANAEHDIYFAPARLTDAFVGKPSKADCVAASWTWADIDPPKDLTDPDALVAWQVQALAQVVESDLPPPQIVVDSGRGLWCYWRLPRELPPSEIEAINYALAQRLAGGDACHNIDRVARLPGTRNTKTGRLARILRDEAGNTPIAALPTLAPPSVDGQEKALGDLGEARPPQSKDEFRALIKALPCSAERRDRLLLLAHDPAAFRVIHPDGPDPADRSAVMFSWAIRAVMAGMEARVVRDCLLSPAVPGISGHLLDERKHRAADQPRAAARQVEQAVASARKNGWIPDGEMATDFRCNDKGQPHADQHNIRLALTRLGVALRYDEFQDRYLVAGLEGFGPILDDAAIRHLWLLIEARFQFRPGKEYFWSVVEDTARQARVHPVRDYLAKLEWDGRRRIDNWLAQYAGADASPYTSAVGRLMLVAAVRRVRQPGCKFDEMVVFESQQGTNKSSALALLAVQDDWFTDDLPLDRDTKVIIERLAGKWIVEAAELKGSRKAEVEHIKAFLSRRNDKARMAYARMPVEVPRQCIIVGSTNSEQYLRDATGNRRFWPVRVAGFDLVALERDRDQLWAEAAAAEAAGESIRLDPALWAMAAEQQERRRVEDPFVDALARALADRTGKLRAADVWDILGMPAGQQTQAQNERVGEVMRLLGWERKKLRFDGQPMWAYARGTPKQRAEELVVRRGDDGRAHLQAGGTPF